MNLHVQQDELKKRSLSIAIIFFLYKTNYTKRTNQKIQTLTDLPNTKIKILVKSTNQTQKFILFSKLQTNTSQHHQFSQMTIASPLLFKVGCATMLSVLGLGAAFGHEGRLSETGSKMFFKGQLYNVTNALGFLACSLIPATSISLKIAIGAFVLGQAIFIAPLYYTAVTDKKHKVLVKMMPLGGASLLAGWAGLLLAA